MAIDYTFVVRLANIYGRTKKKSVYATAQRKETVTTRDIARHISSHNSVFSEGTIIGLLQDAQRCIMENLMAGNRVDLDDLGAFYTSISSRGAASADEFDESFIKRVNLKWMPTKQMRRAIQNVPLNRVPTRSDQRRAVKQMVDIVGEVISTSKAPKAEPTAT